MKKWHNVVLKKGLMDNDFSNWATIVGGFSGLLSFVYVLYEKLTSGAKVVSEITSVKAYEREPGGGDQWYNYDFTIEIELGNIGSKLTSLIKPKLYVSELDATFHPLFAGDNPMSFGKPALTLEAGFASTYAFRCNYRCEKKLEHTTFSGNLEFKQIAGKLIKHKVCFTID